MIEQTKLRKEIITVLQHRDQVRKLLPEAKLQRGRDLPGITKQKKKKMKEKKTRYLSTTTYNNTLCTKATAKLLST
jgi:hypothetical protein